MIECLCCGAAFDGRANRRFCGPACKAREKRRRRRVADLTEAIAHAERLARLAALEGNRYGERLQQWRARRCQAQLDTLVGEKGSQNGT